MIRSTMTVEPHSFEWAVAVAPGAASRPWRGILAARSRIRWLYISKKLASFDIEVQVTAHRAYYIGMRGLANEIGQISSRNSPDSRPSGALFMGSKAKDAHSNFNGGPTWMPWLSPCLNVPSHNATFHRSHARPAR